MKDGKIDEELRRKIYAEISDEFSKLVFKYYSSIQHQPKPGDVLFENDLAKGILKEVLRNGTVIVDVWLSPIEKTVFKVDMFNRLAIEQEADP